MGRLQNVVLLLALIEGLKEKGSWCGETHIQKVVYFLWKLFNVPVLNNQSKFYPSGKWIRVN